MDRTPPTTKIMGTTYKVCPSCNKEKRLWSFHNPKEHVMMTVCKQCNAKQVKEAEYKMIMDVLSKLNI